MGDRAKSHSKVTIYSYFTQEIRRYNSIPLHRFHTFTRVVRMTLMDYLIAARGICRINARRNFSRWSFTKRTNLLNVFRYLDGINRMKETRIASPNNRDSPLIKLVIERINLLILETSPTCWRLHRICVISEARHISSLNRRKVRNSPKSYRATLYAAALSKEGPGVYVYI